MTATIPETLGPRLSAQRTIVSPVSSLLVMYFTYGIYVLLFGTYLYMTRDRQRRPDDAAVASTLYLVLTIVLFVLSTVFVVVFTIENVGGTINIFYAVQTGDYEPLVEYLLQDGTIIYPFERLVPVLLNITAEWMLIHRCYIIWSRNKWVGIPLTLASIIINTAGIAGFVMLLLSLRVVSADLFFQGQFVNFAYSICSATINSILTLLTAGRIWWTHRQLRIYGVYSTDRVIQSVCRIILESGSLYPAFQIANLIQANASDGVIAFAWLPVVILSAGIAPTLVMVRAKLGKNVETLQQGVSDIRFGDQLELTATGNDVQPANLVLEVVVEAREEPKAESV